MKSAVKLMLLLLIANTSLLWMGLNNSSYANDMTVEVGQITLSVGAEAATSITISWTAAADIQAMGVYYIKGMDIHNQMGNAAWIMGQASPLDDNNNRWRVELYDLEPATTYSYAIGTQDGWQGYYSFVTAPLKDDFSFVYLGDTQANPDLGSYSNMGILIEQAKAEQPAFFLQGGDLINDGSDLNEWQDFYSAAGDSFASTPFMPVYGNHDAGGLFSNYFALPQNGPSHLLEHFYSFNYGDALFIVMDSTYMGVADERLLKWLQDELAVSDRTWKIVMFHHPMYPGVDNANDMAKAKLYQKIWLPILENYDVDLVFNGQQHVYMRSNSLLNGKVDAESQGITYIIGVSGGKNYQPGNFDYMAATASASCYTKVRVNGNKLEINTYDIEGKKIDECSINKRAKTFTYGEITISGADGSPCTSIGNSGNYRINSVIFNNGSQPQAVLVGLQVRYGLGAGPTEGGKVLAIYSRDLDLSPGANPIDLDFSIPEAEAGNLYVDVYIWDNNNKQIPLAQPFHHYGTPYST